MISGQRNYCKKPTKRDGRRLKYTNCKTASGDIVSAVVKGDTLVVVLVMLASSSSSEE